MENLRNRIDVNQVNYRKDYLKCISKPNYMSHKIFGCNLVAIGKPEVSLKLNKSANIGMFILKLCKILTYKFHYDYYDNKSKLLFADTDSLIYEIKTKDVYENFSSNKEMFDYWTKSKYYDNSRKISHWENERWGVAIEEVDGLKPKM